MPLIASAASGSNADRPVLQRMPYRPVFLLSRICGCRVVMTFLLASAGHPISGAVPVDGIYLVDDGSDSIVLSDRAPGPGSRLLVAVSEAAQPPTTALHSVRATPFARDRSRGPQAPHRGVAHIVEQVALAQQIDADLLHAVIATESGYAAGAVSPRGAQGLMQLMPATAIQYGVTDPFDAAQNISAGAQHLKTLLNQFQQNKTLALAAYNAGAAAVIRHHWQVPPFAETRAYVPRVLTRYAALQLHTQPTVHTPAVGR
jgi:hypothetical protein